MDIIPYIPDYMDFFCNTDKGTFKSYRVLFVLGVWSSVCYTVTTLAPHQQPLMGPHSFTVFPLSTSYDGNQCQVETHN